MASFCGDCVTKMKYELKVYLWRAPTLVILSKSFKTLHILRNITPAQKCAQECYKSDVLAQTNQVKYDCFFSHGTENTKKIFSQDLKVETKFPGTFF